jgi:hypothetical protein
MLRVLPSLRRPPRPQFFPARSPQYTQARVGDGLSAESLRGTVVLPCADSSSLASFDMTTSLLAADPMLRGACSGEVKHCEWGICS